MTLPDTVVADPTDLARALRNPIRRGLLAEVLERQEPIAVAALAPTVHEYADGKPEKSDSGRLRSSLTRRHLPMLSSVDLVERLPHDEVRRGDHPILSHSSLDPAMLRGESEPWSALAAVFGQPRRRTLVTVLARSQRPATLTGLARTVAAEQSGDLALDSPAVETYADWFHHIDLPLLDGAGVLTYDEDARVVDSVADPDLPIPVPGF